MKPSPDARAEALDALFAAAFDGQGAPPPAASARGHVATWLELLVTWNARIDLTAARSEAELVDLMLADACALLPRLPRGTRVVDVGTGAGAPGLALALLRPDLRVTLVEPLAKRISFLRAVLAATGRTDVTLAHERGEPFAARSASAFDVAISRATLAPAIWIPLGLELAPEAWALLAKDEPPVVPRTHIASDFTYAWPLTKASRRAACYHRAVTTTSPGG